MESEGRPRTMLALVALSLLAGSSCSSSADASNEIAVATVTRCTVARTASVFPELPIEGRTKEFFAAHPLAQLQYLGGRILPSPRVVGVFFGNDPMRRATEALLQSFGCTPLWRDGVGEYGVGDALYERTVGLEALPASARTDLGGFERWVVDGVAAGAFGPVSDEHALLFFLPPDVHLLPDDCTGRLGGHESVLLPDGRRIPYAYFATCSSDASVFDLASRTHAATHELMEMATDPDPSAGPAWRTLGSGLVGASVILSTDAVADEGADFCNATTASTPGYPFDVARNFSNRGARGGRSPCDPNAPTPPLAAPHDAVPGAPAAAIDLSTGRATVVLDVFAEDPQAAVTLRANVAVVLRDETSSLVLDALDGTSMTAHDGDVASLQLHVVLPRFAADAVATAPRVEVVISTCLAGAAGAGPGCSELRILVSHLPPVQSPSDAGSP